MTSGQVGPKWQDKIGVISATLWCAPENDIIYVDSTKPHIKAMKGAIHMKIFRFFLKIISLPFILALSILNPFLTFLLCFSSAISTIASTLLGGMGILMWITGSSFYHSMAIVIMGFLISPFGIQGIMEWMLKRLYDLNDSLKGFVTS